MTPLNILPLMLALPKADSFGYVALIVAICATAFVYFRSTRNWRRRRDPLAKPPAVTSLAQQRSAERQMQTLLVEMSEMARQIGAQLETRATKLDLLIREADDKLRQLQSAAETLAAARARVAEVRIDPPIPAPVIAAQPIPQPTPQLQPQTDFADQPIVESQTELVAETIREPEIAAEAAPSPAPVISIPEPVPVTAIPVRSAASASAPYALREPEVAASHEIRREPPAYPIRNGKSASEPRGAVSAADAGLDNVAALSPDNMPHFDDADDLPPPPSSPRRRNINTGHDALLPTSAPLPLDPRHVAVYELADRGLSIPQIAQRLSRPIGEVELILALRPRHERLV